MQKTQNKGDKKQENLRINIGCLHPRLKYQEVNDYFSNFGVLKQLYIHPRLDENVPKTTGSIPQSYIVCSDRNTYSKILSKANHYIKGIKLDCQPAKLDDYLETKNELEQKYRELNDGKIHIQGIHRKTTEGTLAFTLGSLRKYFSQYGEVKYLRFLYNYDRNDNKGYGFLQIDNKEGTEEIVAKKKHKIAGSVYICWYYVKFNTSSTQKDDKNCQKNETGSNCEWEDLENDYLPKIQKEKNGEQDDKNSECIPKNNNFKSKDQKKYHQKKFYDQSESEYEKKSSNVNLNSSITKYSSEIVHKVDTPNEKDLIERFESNFCEWEELKWPIQENCSTISSILSPENKSLSKLAWYNKFDFQPKSISHEDSNLKEAKPLNSEKKVSKHCQNLENTVFTFPSENSTKKYSSLLEDSSVSGRLCLFSDEVFLNVDKESNLTSAWQIHYSLKEHETNIRTIQKTSSTFSQEDIGRLSNKNPSHPDEKLFYTSDTIEETMCREDTSFLTSDNYAGIIGPQEPNFKENGGTDKFLTYWKDFDQYGYRTDLILFRYLSCPNLRKIRMEIQGDIEEIRCYIDKLFYMKNSLKQTDDMWMKSVRDNRSSQDLRVQDEFLIDETDFCSPGLQRAFGKKKGSAAFTLRNSEIGQDERLSVRSCHHDIGEDLDSFF